MKRINVLIFLLWLCFMGCDKDNFNQKAYSKLVYSSYKNAYKDAIALQKSIELFLKNPSKKTLQKAKNFWIKSRLSYGMTEAFRFYEGPIEVIPSSSKEGPEGQLNAWPVNEAHIDYVKKNSKAGLINSHLPITSLTLLNHNAIEDEANVSLGYHVIEFLLWGQDFSLNFPGQRPYQDYLGQDRSVIRRRTYLTLVIEELVNKLYYLVEEWNIKNPRAYVHRFNEQSIDNFYTKIFTSLATLSGFELASERILAALDSGDQEDEHSCFSDTTHNDYIANIKGMIKVFSTIKQENSLLKKIDKKLTEAFVLVKSINPPIDKILAGKNPIDEKKLKKLSKQLLNLSKLFIIAGKSLGGKPIIISE